MMQNAAHPPFMVPERLIPVPNSISPEAQAVLGMAAESPMIWPPYPALDDCAGWLGYAAGADANMKLMIEARPEPGDDLPFDNLSVGEASCFHIQTPQAPEADPERILFTIHGGALVAGGGDLCRVMSARAAVRMGATVYAPDYRMPPHFPFPTPLDDCLAAYRMVLSRHRPGQIVVHGNSAGGNLAAAMMLRARDEGLPLPAGLVLETPELDLTESGDSFQTNAIIDIVLQKSLEPANRLYAAGHDLANPLLSPLFGDFAPGWPPTLLTAGTRDMFLSNAVRMLHRLRDAGVSTELLVYEAMPHGGFFGTPDDRRVADDVARFAKWRWSAG